MSLLNILLNISMMLFGGGGIIALLRLRHDIKSRAGSQALEERSLALEEGSSLGEQYQKLLRAQAEALVNPLREEVESLRNEVSELREEVSSLRTRYWKAIRLVRDLYGWISAHASEIKPSPPAVPVELVDDV